MVFINNKKIHLLEKKKSIAIVLVFIEIVAVVHVLNLNLMINHCIRKAIFIEDSLSAYKVILL